MDELSTYKQKRNAKKTPEPFTNKSADKTKLFFVIQEHHATRLHFDFRLQVGKVMPSWAIPKGFQDDPAVKRLAMKTEDHPLDYRKFHGTIPEGEYGAGEVLIWDEGTYIPEVEISPGVRQQIKDRKEGEKVMEDEIKKGEIKFYLSGKKIKGSFALVKTKGFPPGKTNAWLLIKHK
ncbi:MAG: DNA polymerase ligase N-terminal domain-containing protein [Candidatus Curtissbacteria bacterium]